RSAGAADRLVARAYQGRPSQRPSVHHDGPDRDLSGGGKYHARCRSSAGGERPAAGTDRTSAAQRAHTLLADGEPQPAGGPPRRLEIFEGEGQGGPVRYRLRPARTRQYGPQTPRFAERTARLVGGLEPGNAAGSRQYGS